MWLAYICCLGINSKWILLGVIVSVKLSAKNTYVNRTERKFKRKLKSVQAYLDRWKSFFKFKDNLVLGFHFFYVNFDRYWFFILLKTYELKIWIIILLLIKWIIFFLLILIVFVCLYDWMRISINFRLKAMKR